MTCNYFIQLLSVRGVPSDFGRVALEVIVRTPRLLSIVRQKYSSEPFPVQAARGVTVHWTQTKAAKAYVRLRLLPGEQPPDGAPAEAAAAAPAPPAFAVTQAASPPPAPVEVGAAALGTCKTAEGLLQLQLGGLQGLGLQHQATQLQIVLPLESDAGVGQRSGTTHAELDLVVLVGKGGGGGGGGSAAAAVGGSAAPSTAPAAGGGTTCTPQAWAWSEVAAAPAPAEVAVQPAATPRKRSWLLALGLGRHGSSSGGGGAAANAVGAGGGSLADRKAGGSGSGGSPCMSIGSGAAATAATVPLTAATAAATGAEGSGQATSAWDPVAALSSVTNTTVTSAATATTATAATLSSASLSAPGCECGSWAPPPGRRRMPSVPALPLPPSPFLPSSLAAMSVGASSDTMATAAAAANAASPPAAAAAAAPPPPPQQHLAAVLVTASSGCSSEPQPQPPKRRRLGDFFARLFHPSFPHNNNNNQVRRIGGVETNAAGVGPVSPAVDTAAAAAPVTACGPNGGSPASSAAPLPAMAGGDGVSGAASAAPPAWHGPWVGKPQVRRLGGSLGVTPLTPPSPRLGDVYRVQDNAMASDTAVQIGFGLDIADATVASAAARPGGSLPPGLDSPGHGETSPAGGPDRLTVEPPVDDMAAASLISPMATSPDSTMGGCFFWRYGAAARARAAQQAAPPPAAGGLGRAGSAPVPGLASSSACATGPPAIAGGQLSTLSATAALPAALSRSSPARSSGDKAAQVHVGRGQQQQQTQLQAGPQGQQGAVQGAVGPGRGLDGEAHAESAAAAATGVAVAGGAWSHPLEGELSRVVEFVNSQTGLGEDLRAVALSQCQFLLDCLRNPDMCWLVGDSLLQLKHEVGFPFDTGVPIPGAPGWFRLVLQPLHPPSAAAQSAPDGGGADGATPAGTASAPLPAAAAAAVQPSPEVLKVRWACIDQRQVGGTNACAAICLEVAAWCLGAVQRWRQAVAASATAASGPVGGGGRRDSAVWPQPHPHHATELTAGGGAASGGRRDAAPALSRSQRDRERERLASSVEVEAMSGAALEQCIREGTAVWQGVLVQSPAARVASSTGDFDLEHMLQLGGYCQRLRLADYSAASLLEDGGEGSGGGGAAAAAAAAAPRRFSREGAAGDGAAAATAAAAAAATSLVFPLPPVRSSRAEPEGRSGRPPALQVHASSAADSLQSCGSGVVILDNPPQPPAPSCGREGPQQCGLPTFAALVRSLQQGVYVLGWHGHFATLWLRPGGVVHLIDSLGARLAADCPLAFVLEFDARTDFLAFFAARHLARRDAAADDDIAGANMAALIEVHRLELLQPRPQSPLQPQR
ncbi:hypothetical protein PLESTB_000161500 [Pleodorina starrii]|uniref:Uncharacterized protein n=1 Tax=Pleodorina starrii TaxID=330485 RepID=A0A9W6BBV9_9CHLO|nr:hypothetical protein PLESTB_000161500 [Pleodorina starrii]GLC72634.1 hypothetical protein PLESTF_001272900 [Pleodorina starrii]